MDGGIKNRHSYIESESLVRQCLKCPMSYGLDVRPHLITFMYRVVLLRLKYLI
jgi:hypothetical protein